MTTGKGSNRYGTRELIKFFLEYSFINNIPIENVIREYLPSIFEGENYDIDQFHDLDKRLNIVENTTGNFEKYLNTKSYDDKIHNLDNRLFSIEANLKNIETYYQKTHDLEIRLSNIETSLEKKMELLARKLFWTLLAASIATLVGIATLIKIISTLLA